MKKILSMISLFAMCILLTACGADDNAVLNKAKEDLKVDTTVTSNMTLQNNIKVTVDKDEYVVNITWKSSNEAVLSSNGVVNRQEKQNIEVILSATLEYNEVTLDKNFVVTVKQKEAVVQTPVLTIAQFLQTSSGEARINNVIIMSISANGYYVTDNENVIFVVTYDFPTGKKIGDKLNLEGKRADYHGMPQMSNVTEDLIGTGSITLTPKKVSIETLANLDNEDQFNYGCYELTGTVNLDEHLYLEAGEDKVIIYASSNPESYALLQEYDGQNVTITVYTNNYHDTYLKWRVCFNGVAADINVND